MAAGGDDDVKILGVWLSPFVMRPRIALNVKKVRYDNPVHKKVPVMIHNDKPISESLVILQYIDEAFTSSGPSILPSDSYDRAIVRFWAAYLDNKLKKASIEAVVEGLGLLESVSQEMSKGKGFFGGDTIGFLYIVLGSYLGWLRVSEKDNECKFLDEDKTPGLYGWAVRFCADAAVKKVMLRTKKLAEYAFTLKSMIHGQSSVT
ncbi:glutathione transferase [Ranunculus cassubicifolius]